MSERAGSGVGYRVRIVYEEPGFRQKNPHCPPEYTSLFDLPHAPTREAALSEAMAQWHFCARHSGVGWKRVIKSVTIES